MRIIGRWKQNLIIQYRFQYRCFRILLYTKPFSRISLAKSGYCADRSCASLLNYLKFISGINPNLIDLLFPLYNGLCHLKMLQFPLISVQNQNNTEILLACESFASRYVLG